MMTFLTGDNILSLVLFLSIITMIHSFYVRHFAALDKDRFQTVSEIFVHQVLMRAAYIYDI